MHASIKLIWGYKPAETHTFDNIVDTDICFYDDIFLSKIGYADFKVTFSFSPIYLPSPLEEGLDSTHTFSSWWLSLNKDELPAISITLFDINARQIARGLLSDWEENRSDHEVTFSCIDEVASMLDEQISKTIHTQQFVVTKHVDDFYDLIYERVSSHVFEYIKNWWISFSHINMQRPLDRYAFDCITQPIANHILQSQASSFKLEFIFNKMANIPRKNILADISKLAQSKIVYDDELIFSTHQEPINITGYIQSINNPHTQTTPDIPEDSLINKIRIHEWVEFTEPGDGGETYFDRLVAYDYTKHIKQSRDYYAKQLIIPKNEYHIWGYVDENEHTKQILHIGQKIKLETECFCIKEIYYEPQNIHSIKSFEATCVKIN